MKKYKNHITVTVIVLGVGLLFYNVQGGQDTNNTQPQIGISVGDIAPAFEVTDIDGQYLASTDLKEKVVVITSSAAWCKTCVIEAQQFAPVYEKYKDSDVVFITLDIDSRDTTEAIQAFKKHTKTPWSYVDATNGAQMAKDYKLSRFEITYIIDKEGIINYKDNSITDSETLDEFVTKEFSR